MKKIYFIFMITLCSTQFFAPLSTAANARNMSVPGKPNTQNARSLTPPARSNNLMQTKNISDKKSKQSIISDKMLIANLKNLLENLQNFTQILNNSLKDVGKFKDLLNEIETGTFALTENLNRESNLRESNLQPDNASVLYSDVQPIQIPEEEVEKFNNPKVPQKVLRDPSILDSASQYSVSEDLNQSSANVPMPGQIDQSKVNVQMPGEMQQSRVNIKI